MEAHVPSMDLILERLANADSRITANHDAVSRLRGRVYDHETQLKVLHTEFEAQREDMKELKGQMKWVLRGLWLAAATFLTFTIALATLVVSLSHG